jgi:hypothetical protein
MDVKVHRRKRTTAEAISTALTRNGLLILDAPACPTCNRRESVVPLADETS